MRRRYHVQEETATGRGPPYVGDIAAESHLESGASTAGPDAGSGGSAASILHLPSPRAFVSHAAPQVGVRESRRVVGRYQLTREDVLGGRRFADGVARASWPIELWDESRQGATYEYLDDGRTYDIPLRSLQARDIRNLFVVGRCMSASHEALGSSRVIGTCLATGGAVGVAAARCVGAQ